MIFKRQQIKSMPYIGPVILGIHRFFLLLCRLGLFGAARKKEANLRMFRECLFELPRRVDNPVFVKVGANDGITHDPCSDLLLNDPAWRGLFIEPVPYLFERLRKNLGGADRFIFDRSAIGPAGTACLYYIDPAAKEAFPDLPAWFDQVGSFDSSHIHRHFGHRLDHYLRKQNLEVVPLNAVLKKHGLEDLHLLHIDTEGYDYQVLSTLDFAVARPQIIFIEHKHLARGDRIALLKLLKDADYRVHDCGDDYFANRQA